MSEQIYFSSKLAEVLFGDMPLGGGPMIAEETVRRFEAWIMAIPTQTQEHRQRLHILAGYLDRQIVARLPGAHQLRIARLIEAKIPELVMRMPTLSFRAKHLRRSSDLAQVFMPDSLDRLAAAIQEEVD